jgi:hypothetical protein
LNTAPRTDLVEAIAAYLATRPHAADSAAGVARWWLGLDATPASVAEVEAALQVLVRRGRLRVVESDSQGAIYGLDAPTPRQ